MRQPASYSDLVSQLIRRGDGAIIVLDCKGDPAIYHTVRIEAKRAHRSLKRFTVGLYRSPYVLNPFNRRHPFNKG